MTRTGNDPTARFFAELAERSHDPLLRKASGTTRIDVVDGRRTHRWLIAVEKGDIAVTRGSSDAACVIRAEKAVFDRIAAGRLNAVAAVLRGELAVDGDWRLLVRMQRLFPSPRSGQARNPRGADSGRASAKDDLGVSRRPAAGSRRRAS